MSQRFLPPGAPPQYDEHSDFDMDYYIEDNVEEPLSGYDDPDYIEALDRWICSNMNQCCAYCQTVRCETFRAAIKEFDHIYTNQKLQDMFTDADAITARDVSDIHTLNRIVNKYVYNKHFSDLNDFDLRWPAQTHYAGLSAPMRSAQPRVQAQQQNAAYTTEVSTTSAWPQQQQQHKYSCNTSSYNEPLPALAPQALRAIPSPGVQGLQKFQAAPAFQAPQASPAPQVPQVSQAPQSLGNAPAHTASMQYAKVAASAPRSLPAPALPRQGTQVLAAQKPRNQPAKQAAGSTTEISASGSHSQSTPASLVQRLLVWDATRGEDAEPFPSCEPYVIRLPTSDFD
ncbi:hypothetical protein F4813DRAFT_399020 [Daldinia decipiens]|uniref:uncharacterized protein n=1 Tax=Daldinia decipiens TaxID=326647 RepID=UPI0020C41800|nr:uncharacterized protein F4813DRAFT_399020 [Daldinia decipiens]KAI1654267.1 hypothetical protein F4813DRAFT_399020 [Daldinia decipiens]